MANGDQTAFIVYLVYAGLVVTMGVAILHKLRAAFLIKRRNWYALAGELLLLGGAASALLGQLFALFIGERYRGTPDMLQRHYAGRSLVGSLSVALFCGGVGAYLILSFVNSVASSTITFAWLPGARAISPENAPGLFRLLQLAYFLLGCFFLAAAGYAFRNWPELFPQAIAGL